MGFYVKKPRHLNKSPSSYEWLLANSKKWFSILLGIEELLYFPWNKAICMGYQKGYYNLTLVMTHIMEYSHNKGSPFVVMGVLLCPRIRWPRLLAVISTTWVQVIKNMLLKLGLFIFKHTNIQKTLRFSWTLAMIILVGVGGDSVKESWIGARTFTT